jgi:hypothetical protein
MASTGFTLPGDSGQIADGGTEPWQNQNAVETEANYADSLSLDAGDETELIYGYDYGFSIPAGATITGIEVRVTRYRRDDGPGRVRTTKTKKATLMDGASTLGNDNKDTDTADWAQDPSTETITYGGSSDLWGASGTIDRAFVQSSDFGAGISAKGVSPCTNSNAYLKFIKINVHYTAPEPEFRAQVIV